jgi:hypothetical protein
MALLLMILAHYLLRPLVIVDCISMVGLLELISIAESTSSPTFLRLPDFNEIIGHAMVQAGRLTRPSQPLIHKSLTLNIFSDADASVPFGLKAI